MNEASTGWRRPSKLSDAWAIVRTCHRTAESFPPNFATWSPSWADARRIALNAGVSRLIVGPASQPLDVGRSTRLVTPAIRRALEHRDRGCVVDHCDIPAHLCEADHIAGWALGAGTSIHEMALCCPFHNRFKNRSPERVHITRHEDGRVTYYILGPGQRAPDGRLRDVGDPPPGRGGDDAQPP